MSVPFFSNLGFTEVNSAGTLNTKAGNKDNLPIQYYKLTADITGVLTINNTTNHKKIILDINDKHLIGASGSSTSVSPIAYSGDDTIEVKGGGLITAGGQVTVTASGSSAYDATPTDGDGSVVVAINTDAFTLTYDENYISGGGSSSTFGARGADNIPDGKTFADLVGTNGTNISGGNYGSGSFVGQSLPAASGNILGGSFRLSTTFTGSSGVTAAFFLTPSGVFKKRVTSDPNEVSEPDGKFNDWGFDGTTGNRLVSIDVNSRLFSVTNNNTFDITFTSGSESVTVSADGGTATLRRYDTTQSWSITGNAAAVKAVSGSGTGSGTVSQSSGGAGASGTVVVNISGSDFAVTNNNNVPINFVAGTGSGTIGASSSGTISGSGSSWSYTGQNYIRNSDSNPKSSATTFSGSGVTNGTAGVPSGGVSLTNFTGKYGRTA